VVFLILSAMIEFRFHSENHSWAEAVTFAPKRNLLAIAGFSGMLILLPLPG
jgi:hypothetical protein